MSQNLIVGLIQKKKMITQVNVTSLHSESTILIMENSQMIRNFGSKLTVKVVIVLLIKNV